MQRSRGLKQIETLASQTTITSSSRLARLLHRRYGEHCQQAGQMVWQTPDILSWEAWLSRCRDEAEELGLTHGERLLRPAEAVIIWQRIIADSTPQLLDQQRTARAAQAAWQLQHDWCVTPPQLNGVVTSEVAAYRDWATQYRQLLQKNGWLDLALWCQQLGDERVLSPLIESWRLTGDGTGQHASSNSAAQEQEQQGKLPAAPGLSFAGFDRLTAAQRGLVDALARLEVNVDLPDWSEQPAGEITARLAADSREELLAAAAWARQRLEQNPQQTLAVLVPDLLQRRSQVERLFRQVFQPGFLVDDPVDQLPPFTLALGEPLADYRLVADTLNLLDLIPLALSPQLTSGRSREIPLEVVSRALVSPFLLPAEPDADKAELDYQLRQLGRLQLSLADVGRVAGVLSTNSNGRCELGAIRNAVGGAIELLKALPRTALPSEWRTTFSDWLQVWGWAAEMELDSDLYQTWSAWQELVGEFAALDRIVGRIDLRTARSQLRSLATQRRFQPLRSDAGLQVLASLEPWPDQFDAIWVVGMHDRALPMPVATNPFLPASLQQRYELPGSSPQVCLQEAQLRLRAWGLATAAEFVVSFPLQDEGRDHLGSPLFDWSSAQLVTADRQFLPAAQQLFASGRSGGLLEHYADSTGLPITDDQRPFSAGAGLLQEQSDCPFKGYLVRRLDVHPLEEPASTLDLMQRGSLVHTALEQFWQKVVSQQRLMELQGESLQAEIAAAVTAAIEQAKGDIPQLLQPNSRQLEHERLCHLLDSWLTQELERDGFTVTGFERQVEVVLGALIIHGRIDRVDTLTDGGEVVIDYKSGAVSAKPWFEERLRAPQLPLYQMAVERPQAIAYAQLKPGDQKFVVAGDSGFRKKKTSKEPEWDQLREGWRLALTQLAEEFVLGRAEVMPADNSVCRYCSLGLVCRIAERSPLEKLVGAEAGGVDSAADGWGGNQ